MVLGPTKTNGDKVTLLSSYSESYNYNVFVLVQLECKVKGKEIVYQYHI